ncbi:hypothetical protein Q361_1206 [Flavobacterium croceum DSM 17960]|uniref:Uncharacterized protein n=1 Tax=Flavobacterium croceum DSM 17960 TaxID=1121886 RepID=A0A2S4N556_9FLAO|nr:hypothetical protein [Flavobacterium croceum]POS00821.1 hypothetical protein Q361_1206 [Flavobacterium croceum DSM 17960]
MKNILILFLLTYISIYSQSQGRSYHICDINDLYLAKKKLNISRDELIIGIDDFKYIVKKDNEILLYKIVNNEIIYSKKSNISTFDFKNLINPVFDISLENLKLIDTNNNLIDFQDSSTSTIMYLVSDLEKKLTCDNNYGKNDKYFSEKNAFYSIYNNLKNLFYDEDYLLLKNSLNIYISLNSKADDIKVMKREKGIISTIFYRTIDFKITKKLKDTLKDKSLIDSSFLKQFTDFEITQFFSRNNVNIFIVIDKKNNNYFKKKMIYKVKYNN